MAKSLIFKPQGGGVRLTQRTALERARLYVSNKKKKDFASLDQDTRAFLLYILNDKFGFRPKDLIAFFPWSSSTVYNSIARANWLRKTMKKKWVESHEQEILDYLLYQDRYLP